MVGACRLETIGPAIVTGIIDARTLMLDGGRQARLSAIEVETGNPEPLPSQGLRSLVGREVVLRRSGPERDRYGRLLVHLFVPDPQSERWIQADLVAQGEARVAARVGDRGCARELLAREKAAREAKLGVWSASESAIMPADDPARLLANRGRFGIVEGKVVSVRESGNTIFVNFGRRWTQDFVMTLTKRNERAFAAAGVAPFRLQGRRVRVRGFIEQRGGPWIEAARPEQIEVLEPN
jgi:Staphylococcal nuclease homologue